MEMERRVGVRSNGETLQRYQDFEQIQSYFISYKNRVELAVEALKDITQEIHEIEMKNVKHKKNGYITSTVGRLETHWKKMNEFTIILIKLSTWNGSDRRSGHCQSCCHCWNICWNCSYFCWIDYCLH